MNNFHKIHNFQQISDLLNFVFANLIEKATQVTIFWNLARNPEKYSSKIRRENAKFDEENEKPEIQLFNREKMLTIFG